ncbi:MAG TPA: poly-beta-1,6-N-acetyl-D-glucosamine biosynthesis protein PgaD [Dyella sp.]|uniref:poly-beta-1,6-N-acetyl-D-glucosamine biosynthesis protein PgaD n=1 Tax=Dyella sp. TaxID=1869338 RepID=UPI002CD65A1D|nr:poly-beta-1,6-N-acetyl-D-glucosamine biosynthesis protein PgaD [Dyella sp.]HUB88169.1 poly-beta-1,6-N-acetyl-D-glucosamine biosynthesis protein PgaD [Dyella sp.]
MKADFIINRPHRQSPLQRTLFTLITMVAWTLWISLWLPLLTLIAWLLGVEDAFKQLGLMHPLHAANDLSIVLCVAIVCALLMGSWSQYNRVRFAGKQRRRGNRAVELAEMAPVLAASLDTARRLRARQRSVVHFAPDGWMLLDADGESD